MRRKINGRVLLLLPALLLLALPLGAQQGPINPRIPPPPPPPDAAPQPAPTVPAATPGPPPTSLETRLPEPVPPPPDLPKTVEIPAGTRLGVVLDTPLSTRMAKKGQVIRFHTEDSYPLSDVLELPPETEIAGSVVEAKKPGHFGKPGVLRVKLENIHLATGASTQIAARLDSPDMKGNGRLTSDSRRTTDLASVAMWTIQGTLMGTMIHGGKGAAVGAGAGALTALIIAMAHKGPDLYLEPGMPFSVIVDEPVELPGRDVYDAQQQYATTHPGGSSARGRDGNSEGSSDPGRPKLRRRPHKP